VAALAAGAGHVRAALRNAVAVEALVAERAGELAAAALQGARAVLAPESVRAVAGHVDLAVAVVVLAVADLAAGGQHAPGADEPQRAHALELAGLADSHVHLAL